MSLRVKLAVGLLAALAVLLAVNTWITDQQTKEATLTVEGGRILKLSRGDIQVTDSGEPAVAGRAAGQPIVLIHCYACSLRWFDRLEPLLAERHRVIRVDLLGFGGSEKPESGYEIPNQAAIVAEAMNELDVEGALVAGNSMGAMVAASLAEQASQLVDRAVAIDMAPNTQDFGQGLPLIARLGYAPILGQALWRLTPDFAVREGYADAFTPGYEIAAGFEDPDQVIEDYRAMTYTSFDQASAKADDYVDELPLDARFRRAAVPLMVMFGAEDQIIDAQRAIEGFADVPGVRPKVIEGAGHAPQIEKPEAVARLLESFAVDLTPVRPPRQRGGDARPPRQRRP